MSKYSTLISQIYRVDTGNIPKEVQFLPCVARLIKSPWNINFSKRSWTNLRSYHKCFNFCVAQWEESFLFRNPCPANGSRFPNELQGKIRYLLPFNFWCTSYMERISVWVWSLFAWIVIKIKSKYLWKYGQMLRLSSNNIIFTPLIAAKIASMIDARQE